MLFLQIVTRTLGGACPPNWPSCVVLLLCIRIDGYYIGRLVGAAAEACVYRRRRSRIVRLKLAVTIVGEKNYASEPPRGYHYYYYRV